MNARLGILLLAIAALAEAWRGPAGTGSTKTFNANFSAWPAGLVPFDAERLPLAPRDVRFAENFPGVIETFAVGPTTWVLRCATRPTREMHPASDCFRGSGYAVHPGMAWRDSDGTLWSRFIATRGRERLRVCERIQTQNGRQNWTDVSAWFWSAFWSRDGGPWIAITRVEPEPSG